MSSTLSLRELDASEQEDQKLLKSFEQFRCNVVRVSSCRILHECIAITTKGGFVQLVNISTGAFRVFLTHLGDTPLESTLRCFSLVPSLYATRGSHYLLYSLSYSNELLLADMERGAVSVLAAFHSRPSTVYCDGDHMVCGEGCGQVTLWRSQGNVADAVLQWRRPVFSDTVICITLQRGYLFCSSADHHCYVLSLETGDVLTKLQQDCKAAVALHSAAVSQLSLGFVMLFLPTALSVYSPPEDSAFTTTACENEGAWSCKCAVPFNVEISCASCCGNYIACGTACGLVLLLTVSEPGNEVVELVRFNVGFPVVCVQLFDDSTLLVVTSAGDVWRWSTVDLLPEAGFEDAEEGEEGTPMPNMHPPTATVSTVRPSDGPEMESYNGDPEVRAGDECEPHGVNQETGEIVVLMDDESLPSPRCPSPLHPECGLTCRNESHAFDDGGTVGIDHVQDMQGEERMVPSTKGPFGSDDEKGRMCEPEALVDIAIEAHFPHEEDNRKLPSRLASPPRANFAECTTTAPASAVRMECGAPHCRTSPPLSSLCGERNFHTTDGVAGVPDSSGVEEPAPDGTAMEDGSVTPQNATLAVSNSNAYTASKIDADAEDHKRIPSRVDVSGALKKVLKETNLSPPAPIEGLRVGRRMNPRKINRVLESPAMRDVEHAIESQSSKMLADYQQAMEESRFDYAAYVKANPLKAEAVKYRYPVKMPVYSANAKVLSPAAELLVTDKSNPQGVHTKCSAGEKSQKNNRRHQEFPRSPTEDDLMDVTYGRFVRRKDPLLEEERRIGGPDIWCHSCDNLLCGPVDPSGTVLFQELRVQPPSLDVLLLPMPLPATPTMF
ncbi:unnamed protein product [Trypanosoma congolense IL3000]|uniref:WGS project CAEQ00000000 data, annotated contig 2324 n=1 Tax=Trypanosoma congolense (strain IL3000) TaxID=1068625 RepID=F9WD59_TRYCI|nr:unnamed protein product [Trypanosoma congolense IL3000]